MKLFKLLCMILTAAVLLGAVPVGFAQEEELPVVISEDFNGENPMEGWTYPQAVMSVVPKPKDNSAKTADPENKCLLSVSRGANTKASKAFEPLGGKVEITYKLRLDKSPAVQVKLPEVMGTVAGSAKILTSISVKKKSDFYASLDIPSGNVRLGGSFLLGVWHDMKLVVDTDKSNFSLWMDKRKIVENVAFYQDAKADSVTSITFFPTAAGAPDFYIDDYCVKGKPAQIQKGADVREMKLDAGASAGLSEYIKQSHPRIMLTSFEELREKIEGSSLLTSWYQMAKAKADSILEIPMQEFSETADNNTVLNYARTLEDQTKTLSLVYQLEGDKKYLDQLYELLENAGAYPTWLPTSFLSVAEFVMAYTVAYDWNYHDWTPQQRQRLLDIMIEKGLTYGVESYQNGKPPGGTNFVTTTNNWNLVCNGALMTSALAIADVYPNLAEYLLEKGAASMKKGVSVYPPQGAYPEGTMYYSYGTGFLTYIMASLETAFREDAAIPQRFRFDQTEGLEDSPLFMIHMTGTEGMFNYGDASLAKSIAPLFLWFAKAYDRPEFQWYYLNEANKKDSQGGRGVDRFFIDSILWYNKGMKDTAAEFPLDHSYPYKSGPNNVLMRSSWYDDEAVYVGLKGGLNRENHSALSVGTFVLDALGERWATMRGAATYSWPGYQDRTGPRYQYYSTRTEGQNTLVLNPKKSFGQDIYATGLIEKVDSGPGETFGVMDMTQAYGKDANLDTDFATGVSSAKRGIRLFDHRSRVLVQDEIKADQKVDTWWMMHTGADIKISDSGKEAMLTIKEKHLYARIAAGPEDARFYVMDAKPMPFSYHPAVQPDNYGKKLAVHTDSAAEFTLAVELVPLRGDQAPPAGIPEIKPLSQWEAADTEPSLEAKLGSAIALKLDRPTAFAQGRKQLIDPENQEVTPLLQDSVAMVPVRFIAEQLGAKVSFDGETGGITIQRGTDTIAMKLDSSTVALNGKDRQFKRPVDTVGGRTMLPLREFCELLGMTVDYRENGLILISQGAFAYEEDPSVLKEIAEGLDFNVALNGKIVPEILPGEYNLYKKKDGETAVSWAGADPEAKVARDGDTVTVLAAGGQCVIRLYDNPFERASPVDVQTLTLSFQGSGEQEQPVTWIPVEGVLADGGYENTNVPENTADNNITTRWSAQGHRWIRYDFGTSTKIHSMSLAGYEGVGRKYVFDVEISQDGETYETVKEKLTTSGATNDPEIFNLGGMQARYVRLQCYGYTDSPNGWNSYAEVRFYQDKAQEQADKDAWDTYFREKLYRVGSTIQTELKLLMADGSLEAALPKDVVLASDNEEIAVVDNNGTITVTGPGTAAITAMYQSEKSVRISSKIIEAGE